MQYLGFQKKKTIKQQLEGTTEREWVDKEKERKKAHHRYKALGRKIGSVVAAKCMEERGIKTCSIIIPEFALGGNCGDDIEGPCPALSEL
eukprot:1882528-Ditylum_brightwellii.AAC.1